jgi:RNA polymerase sigma factor (sigma-70 family)
MQRATAATNPFADAYLRDPSDERLTEHASQGDKRALDQLLRRHQAWIYNVALRMLHLPSDAEDATQEILLKIATHLGSFRQESQFRTWAYRIAANHLLDRVRSRPEQTVTGFDCYREYFARTPDEVPPETLLLVEEAKLSCTLGMLLCLDRDQRLVFVLGEIFEASDTVGAAVLGISCDNFRQKLARARQQLSGFLRDQCGLVDAKNPCRCARKTRAFIRDGIVDPKRLVFVGSHVQRVNELAVSGRTALEDAAGEVTRVLYREQPFYDAPDIASRLCTMMTQTGLLDALHLDD